MGSIATQYYGKFNYLPRGTKPTPGTGAYSLPALTNFQASPNLPLTDIRPSLDLGDSSPFDLSKHGFTARRQESRLNSAPYDRSSWKDENLLRSIYFPEVEELLKKVTGCKHVIPTGAILRSNLYSEEPEPSDEEAKKEDDEITICCPIYGSRPDAGVSTAPKVHLDFTPRGARRQIRKQHRDLVSVAEPVIEAENKLLRSGVDWDDLKDHYKGKVGGEEGIPRFALFSVWRPLKTVTRDPLAVAPTLSFPKSDYSPMEYYDVSFDKDIPPHLAEIIDTTIPKGQTKETAEHKAGKYRTWAYTAHEPRDTKGKGHDWHFISNQQPSEVLIIQFFDNETEATLRAPQDPTDTSPELPVCGAIHSSFELDGQNKDEEARESLEVRCTVFW
jgi:hypothetical protein